MDRCKDSAEVKKVFERDSMREELEVDVGIDIGKNEKDFKYMGHYHEPDAQYW